ncbi:lactonase family protein [Paenibacillus puldeungensis]|uniref:Lactonase family protein n=1 Tax=Paenibacillus puldeungensis TaxID=696536 RepID=A0ABW3S1N9_9BACL
MTEKHQRLTVFVGSYAETANSGVYLYEMDPSSGAMQRLDEAGGMKNPTFLSVDEINHRLYAISETQSEGERIGEAVAFAVDSARGLLQELNRSTTIRPSASHIQLDRANRFVAVSGYHGGNVGLVQVQADGLIGQLINEQQHKGHGADPARQDRPHPHSVLFSPDNRFALVADLGLDKIIVYALDSAAGKLTLQSEVHTPAGSGPRHMAFHPNGRYLYSINEVNSTISSFSFDPEGGCLELLDTVSTLPSGFEGENTTAEIAISGDGRFLYGSNRGHDSIVQFSIDGASGKLTYVEHVSSEGEHPRHFAITPDGKHLITANRDSNNLVVFKVDKESGKLKSTGLTYNVSKPVCVKPVQFEI